MNRITKLLLGIVALVAIDQGTKLWAVANLKDQAAIPILKNIFELRYLENQGAAFGIMQNQQWFFLVVTVLGIAVVSFLFFHMPTGTKYRPLAASYILFMAGALGNCIDRGAHGYVVDFFYFRLIDFPIFNVADVYMVVTAILFLFLFLFYYKDEELTWTKL